MIIGTIALLTLLFGGGLDYFFVEYIEKGVKEYVMEKDRKKEILADLKTSKKIIASYNKEREKKHKTFKKINISRETTKEELTSFFSELLEEREEYQNKMVDARITVNKQIKGDEWDSIMAFSKKSLNKEIEKKQKKLDKNKEKGKTFVPFVKTRKIITENIADKEKQQLLMSGLDKLINSIKELTSESSISNLYENKTLASKDATKDELINLSEKVNKMRQIIFNELINFHILVKQNTNATEWDKVMKTFNKELSITSS